MDMKDLKIAVAGTGYVGLSIATLLLYEQTINGHMPYDGHASRALPNLAAIG